LPFPGYLLPDISNAQQPKPSHLADPVAWVPKVVPSMTTNFPFSGHLDTLNAWWHQDGGYFGSDPIICVVVCGCVVVAFLGL